jgi:putative transposase
LLVDTGGLILGTFVTAANLDDREGLLGIFARKRTEYSGLKILWADAGYQGEYLADELEERQCRVEIVKRSDPSFKVQPRRWVVERTFAWLGKQRRLSKDYEYRTTTSENLILLGMLKKTLRTVIYGK